MTVEVGASDRVLVTGASGFVGSALVAALLAQGKSVRALVRATAKRTNLPRSGVEIVQGDMRDAASMHAAMQGVRYLFHVAADYRLWARDPSEIISANVEGTRNAMEAAVRAGVERIVYTSSVATLALREHGEPADESIGLSESQAIGAYKRSKVAAERLVEAMVVKGLPAVIVNPSTPIGPRDARPTPTGRILLEAARGRMPAYVDTGLNLVHVDDVAAGHLAALRSGRIGERYILGGEDVALGEMLGAIAALVGRSPPRVKLPRAPLFPLAFAAEVVARFTGRDPFATLDGLRMAKHHMFFSSAKAERELRYRHRPYREGLGDALAWFRQNGMLPYGLVLASLALAIWVYLLAARGAFWRARERDEFWPRGGDLDHWPDVVAIVPARDEAEHIGACLTSLLRQNYPGRFSIILVDDESADGTAEIATAAAAACGAQDRLTILTGAPRPAGWSGKVWAMSQGLDEVRKRASPPQRLLFCDADIAFAPEILNALVRRAAAENCALVSLMAKLRCESVAERAFVPAFVFFFQMLYPFAWVNDPNARTAAAAGGCMLADREALLRAGGFEAMCGALIDDCALAALIKRQGPIVLALTRSVVSLRAYPRFADISGMVARSAYAELDYSVWKLLGAVAGLTITFFVAPLAALFASSAAALVGLVAWILMALAFQPMLRFYGRATSWGLALPLIAAAYLAFTLKSAYLYWRGRGGLWKGRVQAAKGANREKR